MRISDWSSDVCSSDLTEPASLRPLAHRRIEQRARSGAEVENAFGPFLLPLMSREVEARLDQSLAIRPRDQRAGPDLEPDRPEIAIAENIGDRLMRSEEPSVGKEGGRPVKSRWSPKHKK